ncbi:uncharacterized protein BDZ99DRAFT_372674, partial [Mytilinidion resinicola]
MDAASIALAEGLGPNEPRSYRALSKCHRVACTTLWNRAHRQPLKEDKAKGQQYLTPMEEKALTKYSIHMSTIGYPVRIKYIPSLAFVIARQRTTNTKIKPPSTSWIEAFKRRNP